MASYPRLRTLLPIAAQSVGAVLLTLILYTLCRLAFLAANSRFINAGVEDLFRSFQAGLRFDLALIGMVSLIPLALISLGSTVFGKKIIAKMTFWLFFFPNAVGMTLNLADCAYFKHSFRRQTTELFAIPNEVARALPGQILENWPLLLLLALFLGVYYWLLKKILLGAWTIQVFKPQSVQFPQSPTWSARIVFMTVIVMFGVLSIRGGFQERPLRPAMAFYSANMALGQLSLNSLYTALWSYAHRRGGRLNLLPVDQAREITQTMIGVPTELFPNDEYPFLRQSQNIAPVGFSMDSDLVKPNVVILIFESWNGMLSESISGKPGVTPIFDSLARDGMLFTNFYASGDRSIQALPAIIAGLPDLTGSSLMNSALELNKIRGLGSILYEQMYQTLFAMGAAPTAMGFDSYVRAAGFTQLISRDDFHETGPENLDGLWGVYDAPFLNFFESRLNSLEQPFAAVFFSLTAHAPYIVPPSFAASHPLSRYTADNSEPASGSRKRSVALQLRGLAYGDFALGEFMKTAREHGYFERTLFVITADHVGWEGGIWEYNHMQRFLVPLLLYAPGIILPGLDTAPGSHADILPTILDALGISAAHAAFGKSLLSTTDSRFAIFSKGGAYGFVYDSLFLSVTLEKALGVFNYRRDPKLQTNLLEQSEYNSISDSLEFRFKAFLQTGMNALVDNRIYPLSGR